MSLSNWEAELGDTYRVNIACLITRRYTIKTWHNKSMAQTMNQSIGVVFYGQNDIPYEDAPRDKTQAYCFIV